MPNPALSDMAAEPVRLNVVLEAEAKKATHKTDIKWMATNICSRQSESFQVWSVFRTKAPFLSILIGCITVSRAVLFRAVYVFAKDATADISPIALCANLRASNVVSWFGPKERE